MKTNDYCEVEFMVDSDTVWVKATDVIRWIRDTADNASEDLHGQHLVAAQILARKYASTLESAAVEAMHDHVSRN